jgi:hypothetical protein
LLQGFLFFFYSVFFFVCFSIFFFFVLLVPKNVFLRLIGCKLRRRRGGEEEEKGKREKGGQRRGERKEAFVTHLAHFCQAVRAADDPQTVFADDFCGYVWFFGWVFPTTPDERAAGSAGDIRGATLRRERFIF